MKLTSAALTDLKFRITCLKTHCTSIKTFYAFFLFLLSTLTCSAQKSIVLDAFSKHGIDTEILDANNLQQPDDYAYDLKQVTIAAAKETVLLAKFDPSATADEQWTVISVNGKSASKSDISTFRKNQNKQTSTQTDDASYKIEKESSDLLVISYKLNAASIPKDAGFMKDCRFQMSINLKTRKLEQIEAVNEKPVKVNILNADKLNIVTKYIRNEQAKRYFAVYQNLNIEARFVGQPVNVQTTTEYSNYTKK